MLDGSTARGQELQRGQRLRQLPAVQAAGGRPVLREHRADPGVPARFERRTKRRLNASTAHERKLYKVGPNCGQR